MTLTEFSAEFRKHHRLFLWGGLVVVLYLAALKGFGTMSHIYELRASVDQNRVLADANAVKAASDQKAVDDAQYKTWKAQSDAQVASLQSQLTSIQNTLKTQQSKDRSLASPELADRLNVLVGVSDGYKATQDGLTATLQAGQSTVVLLDEVPADRATIQDKDKIIEQKSADLDHRQTLLNDANVGITACTKELTDEKKSHADDVKKLKWDAAKGRTKWALIGSIFGALARSFIK